MTFVVWLWYYRLLCEHGFNAFVNSVSLCEHGLCFWFVCVIIASFCFVALVTFLIRVLTNVFGHGIHARARLINRYSACDADQALPGRQG